MESSQYKGFTLRWSKSDAENRIRQILRSEFHHENFLAGGFQIQFEIPENAPLNLVAEQHALVFQLPLQFEFTKPEGLFSIEGRGGICLSLRLELSFPENEPHLDLELISHDWTESPVVTMGSLDFPIEFLADFIIKRIREKHWQNWIENMRSQWDIPQIAGLLTSKYLKNVVVAKNPEWYLNVKIKHWVWVGMKDEKTHISYIIYLDYQIIISDIASAQWPETPRYIDLPLTSLLTNKIYPIHFQLSYPGMEKLIANLAQGVDVGGKTFDIVRVFIRNTAQFEIKFILRSPIEGSVTLTGQPFFLEENQSLDITGLHVDITAEKFLLQLTSPILEKIVRQRIEDWLPFIVTPRLEHATDQLKKEFSKQDLIFFPKEVKVQKMEFDDKNCHMTLSMDSCLVSPPDQTWSLSTM